MIIQLLRSNSLNLHFCHSKCIMSPKKSQSRFATVNPHEKSYFTHVKCVHHSKPDNAQLSAGGIHFFAEFIQAICTGWAAEGPEGPRPQLSVKWSVFGEWAQFSLFRSKWTWWLEMRMRVWICTKRYYKIQGIDRESQLEMMHKMYLKQKRSVRGTITHFSTWSH